MKVKRKDHISYRKAEKKIILNTYKVVLQHNLETADNGCWECFNKNNIKKLEIII